MVIREARILGTGTSSEGISSLHEERWHVHMADIGGDVKRRKSPRPSLLRQDGQKKRIVRWSPPSAQ
jgi:hypothetical protein